MTGNQLKIIALVTMTIDHIGVLIFPQVVLLRVIGRLSYPIFAYMIAEGCYYTHSKKRYFIGIFLLALLCQVVYWFAMGSLEQTILTSFMLGMLVVFAMQYAQDKDIIVGALVVTASVFLALFVCFGLPALFDLERFGYAIDYGFPGAMLPAICYIPRICCEGSSERTRKVVTLFFLAGGLVLVSWGMRDVMHGVQWFSLATVVLLAFYNGKRGKWRMKYLFYVYYPLHLVVIYGISLLV